MASTVFGDFVFKISAPVRDAVNSLKDWDSQLEDTVQNTSALAENSSEIYDQMSNDILEFDKKFGDTIEEQTEIVNASKASWMAFGVAAAAAVATIGYSVLKWSPHMQMFGSLMNAHMQRLGIEVGKVLAPLLKLVSDVFGGFVDWFVSLGENDDAVGAFFKSLITIGGLAFTGLTAAAAVFKGLSWIFGVGEAKGFLSTLKDGATHIGSIITQVAKAGWGAFTAFIGFLAANPIAAFVLALVAVVAAIAAIAAASSDLSSTQTAIIEINSTLTSYIEKIEEIEELNKRVFGEQGGQMVNSFIEHNKQLANQMLDNTEILEEDLQKVGSMIALWNRWNPAERAGALAAGFPDIKVLEADFANITDQIEKTRQATRDLVEDTFTFRLESTRTLDDLRKTFGDEDSIFEIMSKALGFGGPTSELASTFKQTMNEYVRGMSESIATIVLEYNTQLTDEQKKSLNAISLEFSNLQDDYLDGTISFEDFQKQIEILRNRVAGLDLGELVPQEAINRMAELEESLRTRQMSEAQYNEEIRKLIDEYGNGIVNLGIAFQSYDDAQLVTIENLRTNAAAQEILGINADNTGTRLTTFSDSMIDTGDAAIKGAEKMQEAQRSYLGSMSDMLGAMGFGGMSNMLNRLDRTTRPTNYTTINNNQTINAGSGGEFGAGTNLSGLINDMNSATTYENNPYYQQSMGGHTGY